MPQPPTTVYLTICGDPYEAKQEVKGAFATQAEAEAAIALRPDIDDWWIAEHVLGDTSDVLPPGHVVLKMHRVDMDMHEGSWTESKPFHQCKRADETDVVPYVDALRVCVISPVSHDHARELAEAAREGYWNEQSMKIRHQASGKASV